MIELERYWKDFPPSHILHRAWYGWGKEGGKKKPQDTLEFGGGIKPASELPDYLKNG